MANQVTISASESFKETTILFLEAITGTKSKSYTNRVENSQKAFQKFHSKDFPTDQISRKHVTSFVTDLLNEKAVTTVRNYLSCLGAIWSHAYNREITKTDNNPFLNHKIYKPKEKTNSKRPFTIEQWNKYIPELYKTATTKSRASLVAIGLLTGMRINEVLALHCNDIKKDKETGIYYISLRMNEDRISLKNDFSARNIPIHSLILDELLEMKNASPNRLLFGELINTKAKDSSIGKWLTKVRDKTITSENQSFHSLRGMLATAFEQAGLLETLASRVLGHKLKTMSEWHCIKPFRPWNRCFFSALEDAHF